MKVRVLARFRDKHTGKLCNKGDELNITESRFDEILKAGKYVEMVQGEEPVAEADPDEPVEKKKSKKSK